MDPDYRLLAANYVRHQAKQLAEQLDGVRAAEDIEFVHRARVATRRLRAALRMFGRCFPRRQVKRWTNAIRRITTALGDARDRDVQIELLCGTLSALQTHECFPGVARVLVSLEHDRERLQRRVGKAIDELEAERSLREMRRIAKKLSRELQAPAADAPSRDTLARTSRHILSRLDKLLNRETALADPEDRESHHAMRIAAKRLRYTLEICRPLYPGQLDEAVDAIKRVQTLLGEIHDCDVWAEHLTAFSAAERERITEMFGHAGRFQHLVPGIEYLRQNRAERRRQAFEELVTFWQELGRRGLWDRLTATVRPPYQPLSDQQTNSKQQG
ncbi:MAG: CHAD domain-containing protein [Planctomycetaceae bacterium]|nr:CHAD domain-containing protein [Planctomycetaceae bacterium]